ncbi:MAG: hypothetical protein B7X11_02605, partial [Acidobacteria bacterium 37-65-4]
MALFLLAILAVALYYRSRGANELAEARKEFEVKVGPLDPAAYQPTRVKDEDNGAIWLKAGAQAVVIFQLERAGLGILARTPSPQWTPEQITQLKAIQERNAPALALLYRAAGMKVCDLNAVMGEGERIGLPAIHAARLLAADARDALRQGDADRFFKGAKALSTSASAMECAPETILQILGSYEERLLLPVIQEATGSPVLDQASISRLDALVPSGNLMDAWRRALGKEAADLETRMGAAAEGKDSSGRPSLRSRLISWMTGDLDHARYLRLWVETVAWAREPYALRSPSPPHPLGV